MSTDTRDDRLMPVAEAFAHAMAVGAHQAAAATPEDSPPVQGRLPIPRPPFDFAFHWHSVREMREDCRGLAIAYDRAHKAAARAKKALEEGEVELRELLDRIAREEDDAAVHAELAREAAENPTLFPHAAECAFERAHPGQVCAVCAEEREAVRQTRAREAAELTQALEADAETPPVDAPTDETDPEDPTPPMPEAES